MLDNSSRPFTTMNAAEVINEASSGREESKKDQDEEAAGEVLNNYGTTNDYAQ